MHCQGCTLTSNTKIRRRMELADKAHSVIGKARTTQVCSVYIYIYIHTCALFSSQPRQSMASLPFCDSCKTHVTLSSSIHSWLHSVGVCTWLKTRSLHSVGVSTWLKTRSLHSVGVSTWLKTRSLHSMGVSTWLKTRSYSLMATQCGCKYMVKDQVLLTHGYTMWV